MATKLGIYRYAHLILKQNAVGMTVADTDSHFVNTLNLVHDDALRFVLEQGKWNFAARTLRIDHDEDVEPEFGFTYAFEKPEDYRNLIKLSMWETLYPPFGPNEYVDEGNYWYANVDPLYASIVSGGAEYGADLSLWPQGAADALAYEEAFRVAPQLTNMSAEALDRLERKKERALAKAKSWDASKQPPEQPPPSRLLMARRGLMSRSSVRGTGGGF